jgi:hypothetical protein
MPISSSEQGAITEAEFVKIVMLTSDGEAVPTRPVVDDEHRDFDIHRRRRLAALAMQLKTTLRLRKHGRQSMMQITFRLHPPLFTSPQFWYFLAHFNVATMTFTEPMFLVPSTFLHKHARRGTSVGKSGIPYQIKASLDPDAKDKWRPFRVTIAQLGPRIVEILSEFAAAQAALAEEANKVGNVLVVRRRRQARRSSLRRAA